MNKPNPAPEPTMEEILASIRRIISDGEDGTATSAAKVEVVPERPAKARKVEKVEEPAGTDADIFDLTDEMVAEEPKAPAPKKVAEVKPQPVASVPDSMDADEIDKLMAADALAEDDFEAVPEAAIETAKLDVTFAEDDDEPEPVKETAALLSPKSDAAVASAFGRLANTILSRDPRTLEDLVRDMLRPMLKEWLDDNLPVLVEKLVREEIERVSRGRH